MDIKYKQTRPFGCGLFAVANVLTLNNFITPERLLYSKEYGNYTHQLNTWLEQDGHDIHIDQVYHNRDGKRLPQNLLSFHWKQGNETAPLKYLPVLLNVRYGDNSLNHLVGGWIDKQGMFWLHDSMKKEVIVTTLSKVNQMYHNVYALSLFYNQEGLNIYIL